MRNRMVISWGYAVAAFSLAFTFFVLSRICVGNSGFAEQITVCPGHFLRVAMAKISDIFSFSLAEVLICISPLLIIAVLKSASRIKRKAKRFEFFLLVLATLVMFYPLYFLTLGVAYHRIPLFYHMSLPEVTVDSKSLMWLYNELNRECGDLLGDIKYSEGGSSESRMSIAEIKDAVDKGYMYIASEYPESGLAEIDSAVKPIAMSRALTVLGISGAYTFFTGEANINVHLPDYCLPFTVAHELAHARGIARENEADFIAFLACVYSDNAYVKYSGYVNMLEYLSVALNSSDRDAFVLLCSNTDCRILGEMKSYRVFKEENSIEFIGSASDFLNDIYLKSNQTDGAVSYSKSVDLLLSYYLGNSKQKIE